MSSGGTRSVIHFDADHNLHCLVAGRKDFIMIERKYYKDLYFLEKVSQTNWWPGNSVACRNKIIGYHHDNYLSVLYYNYFVSGSRCPWEVPWPNG